MMLGTGGITFFPDKTGIIYYSDWLLKTKDIGIKAEESNFFKWEERDDHIVITYTKGGDQLHKAGTKAAVIIISDGFIKLEGTEADHGEPNYLLWRGAN